MTAPPTKPTSNRRAWKWLALPGLGNGLIAREVRADLSAVVALAGFFAFLIFGSWLGDQIQSAGGARWFPKITHPENLWFGLSVVVAFLLGVLCGAEEQENDTADFALRLPIPRLRIFLEKLAGAFAAFCVWAALSIGLYEIIALATGTGRAIQTPDGTSNLAMSILANHEFFAYAFWSMLFFSFSLAAGAWIGRVLVAAVVSGGLVAVLFFVLADLKMIGLHASAGAYNDIVLVLLLANCGLLLLAAVHFLWREGK